MQQHQQVFSRETKLAEVPPEAQGIAIAEWEARRWNGPDSDLSKQAAEYRKTAPPNTKLPNQKIWTPRDSYGL